jgi:hypothetical protein
MMAMSQLWDRSYYRVCSVPGNGKDSVIDICGSLFGDCATIESPTIAKLEDRATVLKWLGVNEVVDIQKADWDIIQQFLLTAGAHKSEITKRSRAFKNVQEIIDISNFSISLFYNDINCYPDMSKFFDFVTKSAVRDRFPAFRFYGILSEDFNSVGNLDITSFVKTNFNFYIGMIKSFLYFKDNFRSFIKGFKRDRLMQVKGRDQTNLGRLLNIVDFYCDTQQEFDSYVDIINDSMMDYVEMLQYPELFNKLKEKFTEEELQEKMKTLSKINTFVEKNKKINYMLKGDVEVVDTVQIWDSIL